MPETIRTANERLRSRPWRGGFLAAFVIANLLIVPGAPVSRRSRASAQPRSTPCIARWQSLRGQEITLLDARPRPARRLSLFASVVLFRIRRAADRVETDARDEIGSVAGRGRSAQSAAAVGAADPGDLGGGLRAAGNHRRHRDGRAGGVRPSACSRSAPGWRPAAAQRMEQAVDALRATAAASP